MFVYVISRFVLADVCRVRAEIDTEGFDKTVVPVLTVTLVMETPPDIIIDPLYLTDLPETL